MFAAQTESNFAGYSSEDLVGRVNHKPLAVAVSGFGAERFGHEFSCPTRGNGPFPRSAFLWRNLLGGGFCGFRRGVHKNRRQAGHYTKNQGPSKRNARRRRLPSPDVQLPPRLHVPATTPTSGAAGLCDLVAAFNTKSVPRSILLSFHRRTGCCGARQARCSNCTPPTPGRWPATSPSWRPAARLPCCAMTGLRRQKFLPPPSRRALVLCDPSWRDQDRLHAVVAMAGRCAEALCLGHLRRLVPDHSPGRRMTAAQAQDPGDQIRQKLAECVADRQVQQDPDRRDRRETKWLGLPSPAACS